MVKGGRGVHVGCVFMLRHLNSGPFQNTLLSRGFIFLPLFSPFDFFCWAS
ncbi:hypothetical protein Syun_008500 [Stephania yunnanensis]|uniref:Uncharacterized protein n=1 Tax=Stephania yunnanensis TaxID=152371 RepID=A0AAP0PRE4_9MAGN